MTVWDGVLLTLAATEGVAIVALVVRSRRRAGAERALRASEERFRMLAEHSPVMIWTARPDTTLDYFNRACVVYSGMPIEKLQHDGWWDAVHPDDRERTAGIYVPAVDARAPFSVEYRLRRADGVYHWFLATGVPKYDAAGAFNGYLGCDLDITERRESEDRVRESRAALEASHGEIQRLAGRLIESQDAERARLARDLHDDVSQQLAGMSIALSGLRRRAGETRAGERLLADLQAMHERTATLAQNVRHLSHDLHPTVLRHAGLVAALTAHCAELERMHGVASTCSSEGDLASVAPDAAICLYRIAQEALRNVVAHARARRADVRLVRAGDDAELAVSDDGKGFDVAGSLRGGSGLGLVSIHERVRLAGGTVRITSEPGRGTRVLVRIPVRGHAASASPSSAHSSSEIGAHA